MPRSPSEPDAGLRAARTGRCLGYAVLALVIDLYTADVALAYLIKSATQRDVGANFGINRAAPGIQVYAGIAQRF